MKNLHLFKILMGLFMGLFMLSCNNDDALVVTDQQSLQEVVFDINNFLPEDISSKAMFGAKTDGDSPFDESVPNCIDGIPSYVEATILHPDGSVVTYQLNLVTINNKTETEVLKLPSGMYYVTEFVVKMADGTVLWAAPIEGSYYEVLWDLTGVRLPFTVPEFDKLRVLIDVLCYRPYDYEKFGFVWFKYAVTEIHTVCFYGDICTKFFDEWHAERSPYFGQDYDGYDFPAIFYVNIKNADGVIVNDNSRDENFVYANSNRSWFGIGAPLCIEYPDQIGIDETFTFEINLFMPDGIRLIYEGEFNDTAMAEIGNPDAFGGSDGVFDFVIGNCSYDGNDANLELLPWIPVPDSAIMDAKLAGGEPYLIQSKFRDGTVMPFPIPGVIEEEIWYNTLCGEEFVTIPLPETYAVEFYSSLDRELPGTNFPAQYMNYPWGSLNYIANHCEENVTTHGWTYIQQAVWYVIGKTLNPMYDSGPVPVLGVNNSLAQDAMANAGFIPTVGDMACVLIEPIQKISELDGKSAPAAKTNAPEGFQLLIMRVDP